jgi:hypothetical protein
MLRLAAPALLLARAAHAGPAAACPPGMLSVGSTSDGAWAVCERTLSPDSLSGKLVPKGELRFVHANGSVAVRPAVGRRVTQARRHVV